MVGLFVLVLVVAILFPLGLWLLIERETTDQPVMDRGDAERQARQDAHTGSTRGWRPPADQDDDSAETE